MNKPNFWLAAGVAAAILSAGCKTSVGGGAYVPQPVKPIPGGAPTAGQETTLFPVAVGSQWTFTSETQNGVNGRTVGSSKAEVTYRCTAVKPQDGGVEAGFDVYTNGKITEREVWVINKSGIYQLAIGKTLHKFSSPLEVIKFPIKAGDSYDWKGTIIADDGTLRTGSMKTVTGEVERIDTEMGPYNAQPVEAIGKLTSPKQDSQVAQKIWFIPNVGIGRLRQEAVSTVTVQNPKVKGQKATVGVIQLMKLKNFTPGR